MITQMDADSAGCGNGVRIWTWTNHPVCHDKRVKRICQSCLCQTRVNKTCECEWDLEWEKTSLSA